MEIPEDHINDFKSRERKVDRDMLIMGSPAPRWREFSQKPPKTNSSIWTLITSIFQKNKISNTSSDEKKPDVPLNLNEVMPNMQLMPEVQLRVDSAYPGDQGGGKARLDPETMLLLKISPGDLVAIEGKRRTVAKVWRALIEDYNQRKVRMDNFTRQNAGVAIGDSVTIIKITEEVEAKRIVLAPPEDLPKKIPVANNPHVVNGLIDFPVSMNDSVPIMLGLPFLQPQIVAFKVVEIEPEEAVIITKNTSIEFSDNSESVKKEIITINYKDIGGLDKEIQIVREMIELPLRHPEMFDNMGFKLPKGVLLNGPSGIGKTLLAIAVANEACAKIVTISGPEIVSEYYKKNEKILYEKFEEAVNNAPSIIFIDNIDTIAADSIVKTSPLERLLVSQLIELLDGIKENNRVFSIAATIDSKSLDPQLRRSGRFDIEINLPYPDKEGRVKIFEIHSQGIPLDNDINFEEIVNLTEGFTGADIKNLVQMAGMQALKRGMESTPIQENSPAGETKKVLISQKDLILGLEFIKSKIK